MNCKITLASIFSGLRPDISQISPAQWAATVRKSNLDRPFILPIPSPLTTRRDAELQGIDIDADLPNDVADALYDSLIRHQVLFFGCKI